MPDLTQEERAEALRLARGEGSQDEIGVAEFHRRSLLVARALLATEARERELLSNLDVYVDENYALRQREQELREALEEIAAQTPFQIYKRSARAIARAALRKEAE